jgi:hypothetical protein
MPGAFMAMSGVGLAIVLLVALPLHTHAITDGPKGKGKFFIYDWPDELADVYPPPGAALDTVSSYHHDFYPNGGAGKTIDGSIGYFQTWQFSLFKNVMSRLRGDVTNDNSSPTPHHIPPHHTPPHHTTPLNMHTCMRTRKAHSHH